MGWGFSSSTSLQKEQYTDPEFISRVITNCPLQPPLVLVESISLSVYLIVREFLYVPIGMAADIFMANENRWL